MKTIDAFVTGATGLLGRWVVPELTSRGRNVGVLVRDAETRAEELRGWIDAHGGDSSRVAFFAGELTSANLGLSKDDREKLGSVRDVFHLGGVMRFDMPRKEAFAVNVEGTKRVIDLATASNDLSRVIVIGGFRMGHGDPNAKRGAYEESKIAGEKAAIDEAARAGFALSRVQPGTIIGDSRTGETTQLFGFGELVRDLWNGRLPALPGGSRHWMPLVSVDRLARFVARLPEIDAALADGEHVLLDDQSPSLEELLERIARHLGVRAVRRHIPKGALQMFLRAGGSKIVGASAESLDFLAADRYDLARARRAERAMSLAGTDIVETALRTAEHLVATHFDARPRVLESTATRARMERVAGEPTFVRGRRDAKVSMLHGLPLDGDMWRSLAPALECEDALRPDLPGTGRSAGEGSAPIDFMRSLLSDAECPMVIAHSLGTRYAVEYAAAHPNRVRALVLISPFFAQNPPPLPIRNRTIASLALSITPPSVILPKTGIGEEDRAAATWTLRRPGARARVGRALADAHRVRDELMQMLAQVCAADVPVLVIVGSKDPLVVDLPPRVIVRTVEGSGHFPHLEAKDEVATTVRGFFASVEREPRLLTATNEHSPVAGRGARRASNTGAENSICLE